MTCMLRNRGDCAGALRLIQAGQVPIGQLCAAHLPYGPQLIGRWLRNHG